MWDLSLPGYKYLGPGNKIDKGTPSNFNDFVAKIHDIGYGKIIHRGGNPYLHWSEADAAAYRSFTTGDYGGALAKTFFGLKKAAYEAGLITSIDDDVMVTPTKQTSKKRLRGIEPELPAKKMMRTKGIPVDESDAVEMESVTNLQNEANMAEGGGSGNAAGLRETPVDNVYNVTRGPEPYTFVTLPVIEQYDVTSSNDYSRDHVYRMTSPYDYRTEMAQVDLNVGAGTTFVSQLNESSIRSARWFDYYAGIYNYYHVVSCQYNVYIENMSGEPFWAYEMFSNDTHPPGEGSNADHQLWNGVKYHYLDRRYLAVQAGGNLELGEVTGAENRELGTAGAGALDSYESTNHVGASGRHSCFFSGEYRPGDYKREVRLDSEVENWTLVTTNPALTERLIIRIKPYNEAIGLNDALVYGDDLKYRIRIKLNFLVEFKELKDTLKWPLSSQPLSVTINTSVTS